jgi:hypothetical protein
MAEEIAGEASEHVHLGGGLELLLRPLRSDDKRRVAQAFERLSPETRYRRFFAPLQKLSDQDLRYLTEVDHHNHEAIAAVNPENGAIVGVARYVRSDDPSEAEVAVVVDRHVLGGVERVVLEAGDRAEELALALRRRLVEVTPPFIASAELAPVSGRRHQLIVPVSLPVRGEGSAPKRATFVTHWGDFSAAGPI